MFFFLVPTPSETLTAPNTQIVGQSLTLECSVITVRGITSRMDMMWRRNGKVVHIKEGVSANFTTKDTIVHTDLYTITQLNTSDDLAMYQCDAVINTYPKIITSRLVILDITGMCIHTAVNNVLRILLTLCSIYIHKVRVYSIYCKLQNC